MNKKVVVFGATGNLGAPVSVKLKADGYDVVAVGGRKNDNGFFQERGMSYYSVNIKDKDSSRYWTILVMFMPYAILLAVCHPVMPMILRT